MTCRRLVISAQPPQFYVLSLRSNVDLNIKLLRIGKTPFWSLSQRAFLSVVYFEEKKDTLHACGQADRRALNITLNSIGTELTRDERRKLYSNFGLLYPHGHHELAGAEDFDQIRNAMEKCPPYQAIFTKLGYGESQMLDKVRAAPPGKHRPIAAVSHTCRGASVGSVAAARLALVTACTARSMLCGAALQGLLRVT